MKKKTIVLLAAALCIVLGVAIVTAVLAVNDFDAEKLSTIQYTKQTDTIAEPFTAISIENGFVDVQIIPSLDGTCTAEYLQAEGIRFDIQVQDGVLLIRLEDTRTFTQRIGIHNASPYLTLSLPKTQYDALTVRGSSGGLIAPYAIQFEAVAVETSSGDVGFAGGAEKLSVQTSSGDVHIYRSAVHTLRIATSSGACTLTAVTAQETLCVQTSSGDVLLSGCDAQTLDIQTSSGEVTGNLRTGKRYDVQTGSGEVTVPPNADGGTCKVRTSSGDVFFA